MEKIRNIIRLLNGVVDGTISANDALKRWPNIDVEIDDDIDRAWHDLTHYASDDDIRKRDDEYAKYQKALLQKHIAMLSKKYSTPERQ